MQKLNINVGGRWFKYYQAVKRERLQLKLVIYLAERERCVCMYMFKSTCM